VGEFSRCETAVSRAAPMPMSCTHGSVRPSRLSVCFRDLTEFS
jgi:hypothetical protein